MESRPDVRALTPDAADVVSLPRGPGNRRRRRGRTVVVVVVVVVIVVLAATVGAGWYTSTIALDPQHPAPQRPETVLDVHTGEGPPRVVLAASEQAGRPGTYGLAWDGGAGAMLGDVVARGPDRVERPLLSGVLPPPGARAVVTASYPGDPRSALGLAFSEIAVPTELGPAPAWLIPAAGPSTTWAITVHGSNGTRNGDLRAAAALHRAGLPVLSITYRNDVGAPASPDGLMHLGASEWRDVEAAIRTVGSLGAQRVVLYAGSMGGALVGQFLAHSPLAARVSALVLDAPMISVAATGAFTLANLHLPPLVFPVAKEIIDRRAGIDVDQIDMLAHPPAFRPPTLILFGDADTEEPIQAARDLAGEGPRLGWPVQLEEFPGADHDLSWNSDPVRYDTTVVDFLGRYAAPTGR